MKIDFDFKVLHFKRALVKELLDRCTKEQKDLFNRMYKSIEDLKEDQMRHAYFQCKNTLREKRKENVNKP